MRQSVLYMNILKKIGYTLVLTIAVTLTIGPARTFAASPAAASPTAASPVAVKAGGCAGTAEYVYDDMCVLPPFRWGSTGEKLVNDSSGWLGSIKGMPTAVGNMLFTVSGLIWQGLIYIVRFGLSTGSGVWELLDAPVARITQHFGGTLLPLSISLVFITMILGAKKAFKSKGNIFVNFIRLGSSWLIPFSLLFFLVSSSTVAANQADEDKNHNVSGHVGTAAWLATTIDSKTSQIAATFTGLNLDFKTDSRITPGCMEYIQAISNRYIAANDSLAAKDESAPAMIALSNVWINTHYANVIRGQFGTASGDYDLPGFVGCHAYESWSNVPVAEQRSIANESNKNLGAVENAAIYGPHVDKDDHGQFIKAMVAWAACNREENNKTVRPPYAFVDGAADLCSKAFEETTSIPSGKGWDEFYIFGKKANDRLRNGAYHEEPPSMREADERQLRPAEEMAGTMGGLGMSRLLYGIMSLISAIASLIVIGPMALGLLVTVFMSIALVVLALPVALLLLAGGKPEKAKPLFKAIAQSLVAKAMFTIILTLVIAVIKLFNALVLALESSLPGEQLPSLIEALLYGAAPLLAFFVVNKMLKMLIPSANLMNPLSAASLAAQAAGLPNYQNKKKPKYGKDGKELPSTKSKWDKFAFGNQDNRLVKAKNLLDTKRTQLGNVAPTWKNFKKYQPVKRFRSAASAEDYVSSKETAAKAKAHLETAKAGKKAANAGIKKKAADLRKKKPKRPDHEGLRRKPGEVLHPDALAASYKSWATRAVESKNSSATNAKDNKEILAQRRRAATISTGDPVADEENAAKAVEREQQGPVLGQLERDALRMAALNTDSPQEAQRYGYATSDGSVISTRNGLQNPKALEKMTRDELWRHMQNPAAGLGAETLAPQINAETGLLETEVQTAVRIKSILSSRGFTDSDGDEVHAMTALGVSETQLFDYVHNKTTGDKNLDAKLKTFTSDKDICAEFASVDHKAESKAIQIALEVEEERVNLVEKLGLDGANSHLLDQKADIYLKGNDFKLSMASSAMQASLLAINEPDTEKVLAQIEDIVNKRFAGLGTSVPDDAVRERILERAQKATIISVINSASANATAGAASAMNPKLLSLLEGLTVEIEARTVSQQTRQFAQPAEVQYVPMTATTIDNMLATLGVLMADSNRATTTYAAMPPGDDRSKQARVMAISDMDIIKQTNALIGQFEAAKVAKLQVSVAHWRNIDHKSEESIAEQRLMAEDAISSNKEELIKLISDLSKARNATALPLAKELETLIVEKLETAAFDATSPIDASRLADEFASGTASFKKAAAKAKRTGGMP